MKIPVVTRSVKIGEAAAFARSLRDSKIDLRTLKRELVTRRRRPTKTPVKTKPEKAKPPVKEPVKKKEEKIPGIFAPKANEFKD